MATIAVGFPHDFEHTSRIAVMIDGLFPEHEQIWVWDHFFALAIHRIAEDEAAPVLLDTLAAWASNAAPKLYSPINELHAENTLKFDTKLSFNADMEDCEDVFVIETTPEPNSWPGVKVKLPDKVNSKRLSYSVLALGQYFLAKNQMFFRELPLHILAMRKYYNESTPFSDAESVSGAPLAAFNTAMKFFNDMNTRAKKG